MYLLTFYYSITNILLKPTKIYTIYNTNNELILAKKVILKKKISWHIK